MSHLSLIEEILPQIYRIEVPLPRNPLKALNSYLLKGEDRSLLVDTGFNQPECGQALTAGLQELGVDLHKTDFFITHLHADHCGLVSGLAASTSRVYCSQSDARLIELTLIPSCWQEIGLHIGKYGFPADDLRNAIEKHPAKKYCPQGSLNYTFVGEGDRIVIGDYRFTCVETPGHTPGHLCLYEPQKKILISGDHILGKITPNITIWQGVPDSLGQYLESLDKIYDMEITLVLPGHRQLIHNCRQRIDELKRHHRNRLDEILAILRGGEMDAYQVAARMTWDLSYDSWEQFPSAQKWFATGEAASHLEHLAELKKIQRIKRGEYYTFRLST